MSTRIERINLWIQIFTSRAIIAGLGLVVWELKLKRRMVPAKGDAVEPRRN